VISTKIFDRAVKKKYFKNLWKFLRFFLTAPFFITGNRALQKQILMLNVWDCAGLESFMENNCFIL
jgi:hypothetical protein